MGTAAYACPELYENKAYSSEKQDIFSLGRMLHMMITCEHPWMKPSLLEDEGFHTFVNFPSTFWKENQARLELSMDLKHLISGMMRLDPVRRFTLSDIHNHPWLLSSEEDYSQHVN